LSKRDGREREATTESFHASGSALGGSAHKGGMIMDYQNITTAKELLVEMDRISKATCRLFTGSSITVSLQSDEDREEGKIELRLERAKSGKPLRRLCTAA